MVNINAKYNRIGFIDLIKGIDIILMILFNYSITLDYFDVITIPSDYFYRNIIPISIALAFIFISGVNAHISYERNPEGFAHRYFLRGLKLAFFALLITLFTYIFVPGRTVYFGILHFFAAVSFFVPIIIRIGNHNRVAGVLIIIFGIILQQMTFGFSYLMWLGFVPFGFSTFDYFPLIPWTGVIFLGIYYSRYFIEKTAGIKFRSNILEFTGKHSLTVYLIHQPVLVLILIALGFKLF